MAQNGKYDWKYASIGGAVRVRLESGEDIAHLGELDQKKWTVLSCPAQGLDFDAKTLALLDTDGDGKIRVHEVVAAAEWLTSVVKDKDLILKGDSVLPLDQINTENETGAALYNSAKQILANLGLDKQEISIADTADSVAIFKGTAFNGDGIVVPASAGEDAELAKVITDAVASVGGFADRSGEQGVDAAKIEAFYAACADYAAWQKAAVDGKDTIFPYGDNTAAALAACEALKDKVADYFMRCKIIAFNEAAAGAVDVSVDKIGAIADKNLAACADEIGQCPLARPSAGCVLPFEGVNPAWQGAFATLKALVLDVDFPKAKGITEAEWNATLAKFGPYTAWTAAKKGAEVEGLGLEAVEAVLKADRKADLLALVEKDVALKAESESIDAVDKLLHLYRDFYHLLCNYVVFSDFYGRNDKVHAIFECGKLYIDERCCNLCIKVSGSGNHAEAAQLGGMFLIYCTCTSKKLGKTQEIMAVMTDGGIKNLRPGKNAVFYDMEGNDWDAVVTKIVDNPISIKQAFWGPYRKLAQFISDKIDKSAAEKDSAATADLLAKADNADPTAPAQPFDIGKFAGIFAAIGMAVGALGAGLGLIISGLKGLAWWKYFVIIAAIMLVISGPACFIAWRKLRKRNLGPVLNANGWAINSIVLINILFGGTLTSVAKYPLVKGTDPFAPKTPKWKKWLRGILIVLVLAFAALFFTDNLKCIGLPFHKDEPVAEEVADAPAAEEAPAEAEVPAE